MSITARSRQSLLKRIVLVAALSVGAMSWMISRPRISPVAAQSGSGSFQSFEAPQIHPLTITPDGARLLACNTHNNSLSVFQLSGGAPTLTVEIPLANEFTEKTVEYAQARKAVIVGQSKTRVYHDG